MKSSVELKLGKVFRSVCLQNGVSAQDAGSNTERQEKLKSSKLTLSYAAFSALIKSRIFYRSLTLVALFSVCTLFYYFGELVDFAGWTALRWEFFYSVHDIHRLLFLAPMMYAYYFFGTKALVTAAAASLVAFLPRAIFISPFPDPLPRAVLSTIIIAFFAYSLIRITRNNIQQSSGIRAAAKNEESNFVGVQRIAKEDRAFTTQGLEIDFSRRLVKRDGQIVKLTPTEYRLLEYLVRNSGKVLTQIEILHNVWGAQYGQESEYVRNFIRQLRRKIEDDASNPQFIVTVPRFGYRFFEPEDMPNNQHSPNPIRTR
jgi:DNA-binding winged helix-turn-helix (wHTH) protein